MNIKNQFMLDNKVTFLNHGSFGACPKEIFNEYQSWQKKLETQPVKFLDQYRDFGPNMTNVRKVLSKNINSNINNLVPVVNATTGLNAIIKSLHFQKGDEILMSNHEYGALEKTWQFMETKFKIKIKIAKVSLPITSEKKFIKDFVSKFNSKTKILFLSHITSPTALLFPIKKLIKIAREKNIISIIDGAHAPGHIDLNLKNLNADFYSGNCHKWMMSPKGSAFMWSSSKFKNYLDPLIVSHGWNKKNKSTNQKGALGNSRFIDMFEYNGTKDPAAWLSVPASIKYINKAKNVKLFKMQSDILYNFALKLSKHFNIPLLADREFLPPLMIAVPIPKVKEIQFQRKLYKNYKIEIPIIPWENKSFARISFQLYNSIKDLEKLEYAIKKLLI
ncbi:aminotransferase class V-fold PLP-dependent enzyme [Pelagibacteraceae bacterium]|nr:aminotransferase class V-fold PLP-dependent enzyme [Pelagibacteraceae bacterium]